MGIKRPKPTIPGFLVFCSGVWNAWQTSIAVVHARQDAKDVWRAVVSAQNAIVWVIFALAIVMLVWSVWHPREGKMKSDLTPLGDVIERVKTAAGYGGKSTLGWWSDYIYGAITSVTFYDKAGGQVIDESRLKLIAGVYIDKNDVPRLIEGLRRSQPTSATGYASVYMGPFSNNNKVHRLQSVNTDSAVIALGSGNDISDIDHKGPDR